MDQKICILGSKNNLYTRIVLKEFHKRALPVDLLILKDLRKERTAESLIEKAKALFEKYLNAINSYPFKALPKYHYFFWKKLISTYLFYQSDRYHSLVEPYQKDEIEDLLSDIKSYEVQALNSDRCIDLLDHHSFSIGILAGVDEIIGQPILEAFNDLCLNAHPAPLPVGRGGGALQQTLAAGEPPGAAVHKVTPEIDAGKILVRKSMPPEPDDDFNTVRLKLDIFRAQLLAETVEDYVEGKEFNPVPNDGKLHYWSDCTLQIQQKAERKLKEMQSS